jgi:hypothetical protein
MTMRVSWVSVKDIGCCSRKWICNEGEKGRARSNTPFSTFSMLGEKIPRPALYYVNFRNNVIYIILYYYYYREEARKFGASRSCGLCDRIEL